MLQCKYTKILGASIILYLGDTLGKYCILNESIYVTTRNDIDVHKQTANSKYICNISDFWKSSENKPSLNPNNLPMELECLKSTK